ncbi:hypothetical protein A2U01_0102678, partial [Trifolium medium]|nr:hypothetical protein [Trifolium medium]
NAHAPGTQNREHKTATVVESSSSRHIFAADDHDISPPPTRGFIFIVLSTPHRDISPSQHISLRRPAVTA